MKILRAFLILHIIISILLIILVLYGSQIFAALGLDIPWDEMVNEAGLKLRDGIMYLIRVTKTATISTASWLADVMHNASETLSGWVAVQTG